MNDKRENVINLRDEIENACIKYGLNLTVYDGKIGFVDQKENRIIALWEPQYSYGAKHVKEKADND